MGAGVPWGFLDSQKEKETSRGFRGLKGFRSKDVLALDLRRVLSMGL